MPFLSLMLRIWHNDELKAGMAGTPYARGCSHTHATQTLPRPLGGALEACVCCMEWLQQVAKTTNVSPSSVKRNAAGKLRMESLWADTDAAGREPPSWWEAAFPTLSFKPATNVGEADFTAVFNALRYCKGALNVLGTDGVAALFGVVGGPNQPFEEGVRNRACHNGPQALAPDETAQLIGLLVAIVGKVASACEAQGDSTSDSTLKAEWRVCHRAAVTAATTHLPRVRDATALTPEDALMAMREYVDATVERAAAATRAEAKKAIKRVIDEAYACLASVRAESDAEKAKVRSLQAAVLAGNNRLDQLEEGLAAVKSKVDEVAQRYKAANRPFPGARLLPPHAPLHLVGVERHVAEVADGLWARAGLTADAASDDVARHRTGAAATASGAPPSPADSSAAAPTRTGHVLVGAVHQARAVRGIGGVGKTTVGQCYVRAYADRYPGGVLWIPNARTAAAVHAAYRDIAVNDLGWGDLDGASSSHLTKRVLEWLASGTGGDTWLLVLDNADDPGGLQDVVPTRGPGHVLYTSRAGQRKLEAAGVHALLAVECVSVEEGATILVRVVQGSSTAAPRDVCEAPAGGSASSSPVAAAATTVRADAEYEALMELSAELGGLPLALEQAGAAVRERFSGSFAAFLAAYREVWTRLFASGVDADADGAAALRRLLAEQGLDGTEWASRLAADDVQVATAAELAELDEDDFRDVCGTLKVGARDRRRLTKARAAASLATQPATRTVSTLWEMDLKSLSPEARDLMEQIAWLAPSEVPVDVWVVAALCGSDGFADGDSSIELKGPLMRALSAAVGTETTELAGGPSGLPASGVGERMRAVIAELESLSLLHHSALRGRHDADDDTDGQVSAPFPVVNLGGLAVHRLLRQVIRDNAGAGPSTAIGNATTASTGAGSEVLAIERQAAAPGLTRFSRALARGWLLLRHVAETRADARSWASSPWAALLPHASSVLDGIPVDSIPPQSTTSARRAYMCAALACSTITHDAWRWLSVLDGSADIVQAAVQVVRASACCSAEDDVSPHFTSGTVATCQAMGSLASLYRAQSRPKEAQRLIEEALSILKSEHGTRDSLVVAQTVAALADTLVALNRPADAERLFWQAFSMLSRLGDSSARHFKPAILNNIAVTCRDQGRFAEAERQFKAVLAIHRRRSGGTDSAATASTLNNLADVLSAQSRFDEAVPLLLQSLDMRRRVFTTRHSSPVAQSLANLAVVYQRLGRFKEAEKLLSEASETTQLVHRGKDGDGAAVNLNYMAEQHMSQGRLTKAEPLLKDAVAMMRRLHGGSGSRLLVLILHNLGVLYHRQSRLPDAELALVESLEVQRRLCRGTSCPDLARELHALGQLRTSQSRWEEADALYSEALGMYKRIHGARDSTEIAALLSSVAFLRQETGDLDDALLLREQALAMRRSIYAGHDSPEVAEELRALASVYTSVRRLEDAETLLTEALSIQRRICMDCDSPDVAATMARLAQLHRAKGRCDEVEPLFEEALAILRRVYADCDSKDIASILSALAGFYRSQRRFDESESLYQEAIAMLRRIHTAGDSADLALTVSNMSVLYKDQGRLAELEPLLVESLGIYQRVYGDRPSAHVADVLDDLGTLYTDLRRPDDAAPRFEEALALRRRLQGSTDSIELAEMLQIAARLQMPLQADKALSLQAEAVEVLRRLLANPSLVGSIIERASAAGHHQLGQIYDLLGRQTDAIASYEEAVAVFRRLDGERGSASLANALMCLGGAHRVAGRLGSAVERFKGSLAVWRRLGNDCDPQQLAVTLNNLGSAYTLLHRFSEAETPILESLALFRGLGGERGSIDLAKALNNLGEVRKCQDRLDDSAKCFAESLAIQRRLDAGGGSRELALTLGDLAEVRLLQHRASDAESHYSESLAILKALDSDATSAEVAKMSGALGVVLALQNRHDDAEPLLTRACELGSRTPDSRQTAAVLYWLAQVYTAQGRLDDAESRAKDAFVMCLSAVGPDDPLTNSAHVLIRVIRESNASR